MQSYNMVFFSWERDELFILIQIYFLYELDY